MTPPATPSPRPRGFTTAADGTAPTVTARTPAAGATGFSRTGNVTATFSEAVRTPTAQQVTLRVGTTATGTLVASAVTYDSVARRVTLNPNVTLAASTQYTVRLTGILDTAGNALAPVTWSFRTGA